MLRKAPKGEKGGGELIRKKREGVFRICGAFSVTREREKEGENTEKKKKEGEGAKFGSFSFQSFSPFRTCELWENEKRKVFRGKEEKRGREEREGTSSGVLPLLLSPRKKRKKKKKKRGWWKRENEGKRKRKGKKKRRGVFSASHMPEFAHKRRSRERPREKKKRERGELKQFLRLGAPSKKPKGRGWKKKRKIPNPLFFLRNFRVFKKKKERKGGGKKKKGGKRVECKPRHFD